VSTAGIVIPRTDERLETVRRHLEAGKSAKESAAALGVTTRTVSRLRARLRGYTLPHIPQPTQEQLAEYERRLDEGWSFKEIARTYHCCENMLARRFPGRGWDRSTVGRYAALGRLVNALPDRLEETKNVTFASLSVHKFSKYPNRNVRGRHIYSIHKAALTRQAESPTNAGQPAASQTLTGRMAS
jgi:hypothetical protein